MAYVDVGVVYCVLANASSYEFRGPCQSFPYKPAVPGNGCEAVRALAAAGATVHRSSVLVHGAWIVHSAPARTIELDEQSFVSAWKPEPVIVTTCPPFDPDFDVEMVLMVGTTVTKYPVPLCGVIYSAHGDVKRNVGCMRGEPCGVSGGRGGKKKPM